MDKATRQMSVEILLEAIRLLTAEIRALRGTSNSQADECRAELIGMDAFGQPIFPTHLSPQPLEKMDDPELQGIFDSMNEEARKSGEVIVSTASAKTLGMAILTSLGMSAKYVTGVELSCTAGKFGEVVITRHVPSEAMRGVACAIERYQLVPKPAEQKPSTPAL